MNQAYPLDAVIREVSRDVEATADGERRIIIDLDLRRAVDKKRLLHNARYFIVTNRRAARKGAEYRTPLIAFNDFENDRKIAVQVVYLATCEPGSEQQMAEALFDGPHPAAVLNEKIKRWLRDYAGQRPTEFVSQ